MVTSLGPSAQQILLGGRNDETTALPKGKLVKIDFTTALTFDDTLEAEPVLSFKANDTADTTAGAGGVVAGIAIEDIPAGEYGRICAFGLVKAISEDGGKAVGTVLAIATTDKAELEDAANASDQSPCAIALEATVADSPTWVFADFISSSFGSGPAGALVTTFWGQAF